jgi:hypothetical protein
MGALTEAEIFDCLSTNMRSAAQHAVDLAKKSAKGQTYRQFREELKTIEGCCRQLCAFREDARWLNIANVMGEAHRLAGGWLRGVKTGKGPRVKIPEGELHPMFMRLAAGIEHFHGFAMQMRRARTGRVGMILPRVLPDPGVRQPTNYRLGGLPGGMTQTPSGLIIPASVH